MVIFLREHSLHSQRCFVGVTFTSRQIKLNERVHMEIVDVDESGQWLGSLAIGRKYPWRYRACVESTAAVGFTQVDPDSIQRSDLCKSALPNLCQKDGASYIKRIFEKLSRQIVITFYYNQEWVVCRVSVYSYRCRLAELSIFWMESNRNCAIASMCPDRYGAWLTYMETWEVREYCNDRVESSLTYLGPTHSSFDA